MTNLTYPFYVQTDSVTSLYNHLTTMNVQSQKTTTTNSESKKDSKGVKVVASLLQILGLEANIAQDKEASSDYADETVYVLESEQKAKLIRQNLHESKALYNLNVCLQRKRPFGSFIDFRCTCIFTRKQRFVEIIGNIETTTIKTICSPEYFQAKSFLVQAIFSNKPLPIYGFGIVVSADPEKKLIEVKSLVLALENQGFRM